MSFRSSKPRLMILGASRYYARAIIEAKSMGCWVVAVDKNPNAPGLEVADSGEIADILDESSVLDVAKKQKIDGVLALNDYGVNTAAYISYKLNLDGLPRDVAKKATDKYLMREAWKGRPYNPDYALANELSDVVQFATQCGFPIIVKPRDSRGGGSRGVYKIDSVLKIEEACKFAKEYSNEIIVERCVEGIEHSVEAVVINGKTNIILIGENIKLGDNYRVNKSIIYPTLKTIKEKNSIERVVQDAINRIGIENGIAHIELCMTNKGPFIFELGARCGGGGIATPICEWVSGISEVKQAIKIALRDKPDCVQPSCNRGCIYRFLTPTNGKLKFVKGIDVIRKWANILDCDVLVKNGEIIREIKTGGDRAGFIIAGGSNRAEALELADKAEKNIYFEYFR